MTMTSTNAAAVSRALKAGGVMTSHAERRGRFEGVYVSGSGRSTTVSVDIDGPGALRRIVEQVVEVLTAKGYGCEVFGTDDALVRVTRPTAAEQVDVEVDEQTAAPALATYVEGRTRQTEVVALRAPRSGPLEGVTTVTRRDTGADIGTVRRSATGTAWFATMPNGGGLGGTYTARQMAVGALIDHAVLSEADEDDAVAEPAPAPADGVEVVTRADNTRLDRPGSKGARVTRLAGSWGWWSNGTRTEVDGDRAAAEAAARAYVASDASLYADAAAERELEPGEPRFPCVQHGHRMPECGPECDRLTTAYYAAPQPLTSQQRRDRRVKDDEQVAVGTPVRVIAHGFGARRRDVGRWGVVVSHRAGQRLAVELAAANDCPTEVRRLHPDELVLELPADPAPYPATTPAADVDRLEALRAASGLPGRDAVDEQPEQYGEAHAALARRDAADADRAGSRPRVLDEPVPAPAGWYAYGRRRENDKGQLVGVGVVHLIDREGVFRRAGTSACGRPLKRGAVVQSWVKVDCADCLEVAQRDAELWGSDTLRLPALDAKVAEAQQRRKGHPGPARRTTSVRFTEAQYAAIDAAVEAGYADGLNAVLARLIDERLTGNVLDGGAR